MYLTKLKEKATGKTRLFYQHQVRDKATKKKKTITVKDLGYLEDYLDKYDDPIQHFKDELQKDRDAKSKLKKKQDVVNITLVRDEILPYNKLTNKFSRIINTGDFFILWALNQFGIIDFLRKEQKQLNIEFSLESFMKLMIYKRILSPGSKLKAWQTKDCFFEHFDLEKHDIYRGLTQIAALKDSLLLDINNTMVKKHNRDNSFMFYDVTNVHFEIEDEDGHRMRGVSKSHKPLPIVQVGMFMDKDGLPVWFDTYDGNTNDCLTFLPSFKKVQNLMGLNHAIYVADKAMHTGDNIANIIANQCGYVISESARKCSKKLKNVLLDPKGYITYDKNLNKYIDVPTTDEGKIDFSKIDFMFKEYDMLHNIKLTNLDGRKTSISNFPRKKIIYWSKKYSERAKLERQRAVMNAENASHSKTKSVIDNNYGSNKYLKTIVKANDGKKIEKWKAEVRFDNKKLEEEELLDGFYIIETNVIGVENEESIKGDWISRWNSKTMQLQLNKVVNTHEIIDMYRGLWQIEECFRITKSELDLRPVYVSKENHIEAHVLICMISLMVIRFLDKTTENKFTTNELLEGLRESTVSKLDGFNYLTNNYSNVLKELKIKTGIDLSWNVLKKSDITKIQKILKVK
ncbi:MAG: IS1634 family transposase [Sphaerochaetaceae bacterium]|jgi:transposase|nr:IS1634 family transposase [Sphaerochaetaceae bacterium]